MGRWIRFRKKDLFMKTDRTKRNYVARRTTTSAALFAAENKNKQKNKTKKQKNKKTKKQKQKPREIMPPKEPRLLLLSLRQKKKTKKTKTKTKRNYVARRTMTSAAFFAAENN